MKIGVMSLAHLHALGYIRLLSARPDVELAVADPDAGERPPGESGGRALAEELGVDRYFDTYEELLDWAPDGVVVCSENSRHRELTELAAAAGAHVLCEKPMATTVADGEAMVAACAAAGVHLMVAYPVRFSRQFRALQARPPASTGSANQARAVGSVPLFVPVTEITRPSAGSLACRARNWRENRTG